MGSCVEKKKQKKHQLEIRCDKCPQSSLICFNGCQEAHKIRKELTPPGPILVDQDFSIEITTIKISKLA